MLNVAQIHMALPLITTDVCMLMYKWLCENRLWDYCFSTYEVKVIN
jgi:hypothetical protein